VEGAASAAGATGGFEIADRSEMVRAIQLYQIARMRVTHEALFRSPSYAPLCEFFVADLYGPRQGDTGSRATALHSLVDILRPALPRWVYDGAIGLIELHSLSEQLDDRLARALVGCGVSAPLAPEAFEAAYLRCDDYPDRLRQIDLSETCTSFGHALSTHRSIGRLLAAARALRGVKRLDAVTAMLERGYRAFRGVAEIAPFNAAMRAGETAYLDGIYARGRAGGLPGREAL